MRIQTYIQQYDSKCSEHITNVIYNLKLVHIYVLNMCRREGNYLERTCSSRRPYDIVPSLIQRCDDE